MRRGRWHRRHGALTRARCAGWTGGASSVGRGVLGVVVRHGQEAMVAGEGRGRGEGWAGQG